MFRKLVNSSKPELVTAKLTKQQFWQPLYGLAAQIYGLAAQKRPVPGCEARTSSELRILINGFGHGPCFSEPLRIQYSAADLKSCSKMTEVISLLD